MTWKRFPYYWTFVKAIHQSPVDCPHKQPVIQALMFPLMLAWTNGWTNSQVANYLRHHDVHCDVTVMRTDVITGNHVRKRYCTNEILWYNYVNHDTSMSVLVSTWELFFFPHNILRQAIWLCLFFINSHMKIWLFPWNYFVLSLVSQSKR